MNHEEKDIPAPPIRILKIGSCLSLSGKSTLTYHLGCTTGAEIRIRIFANSGGGFFSQEWIPLNTIEEVLEKTLKVKAITSFALKPLFRGKSVNSTGFLLAILKCLGLVRPLKEKQRCYGAIDFGKLTAEVKTLMESITELKESAPPSTLSNTRPDPSKKAISKGKVSTA